MPQFTNHAIRTIRIEPKPEVAAFYDPEIRFTEIAAGWLSLFAVLYFAGHFVAAYLRGQL